jgi:hypothetical protein
MPGTLASCAPSARKVTTNGSASARRKKDEEEEKEEEKEEEEEEFKKLCRKLIPFFRCPTLGVSVVAGLIIVAAFLAVSLFLLHSNFAAVEADFLSLKTPTAESMRNLHATHSMMSKIKVSSSFSLTRKN